MFGEAVNEIQSGAGRDVAIGRGLLAQPDWQCVDRALRGIARHRAGMDAEEAKWLREAEACKLWKHFGMVSAFDYIERILGYGPRAAQDRLRVARALGSLPVLSGALSEGALSYSAVRELTRVAAPRTETAWRDASVGLNLRQLEELVADHKLGDRPEDPPDPEARVHIVRLELAASTFAVMRQARQNLDAEHGRHLSDDEWMAALCNASLGGSDGARNERASSGRAKFQVAMTVCERCRQGWQEGAGVQVTVDGASVERALCDAQQIGSIDGAAPEQAHQDITPSVARLVWTRDHGRCRAPGCRSTRGLEIHHLMHRAAGGGHEAENLALLCSSCHHAHHEGRIQITGSASRLDVHRPCSQATSGPRDLAKPGAHVGAPSAKPAEHDGEPSAELAKPGCAGSHGPTEQVSPRYPAPSRSRRVSAEHTGDANPAPEHPEPTGGHSVECARRAGSLSAGRAPSPLEGESSLARAERRALAETLLVDSGWKTAVARVAVEAAERAVGDGATLEVLVREAFRRCPM